MRLTICQRQENLCGQEYYSGTLSDITVANDRFLRHPVTMTTINYDK